MCFNRRAAGDGNDWRIICAEVLQFQWKKQNRAGISSKNSPCRRCTCGYKWIVHASVRSEWKRKCLTSKSTSTERRGCTSATSSTWRGTRLPPRSWRARCGPCRTWSQVTTPYPFTFTPSPRLHSINTHIHVSCNALFVFVSCLVSTTSTFTRNPGLCKDRNLISLYIFPFLFYFFNVT